MNQILDLKLAVRRLIREPGFSLPAVLTIAIGIGIAASVFAFVYAILIRPLPYPEADRLVSIRHEARDLTADGLSPGTYLHYRDRNRVFEVMGAYDRRVRSITDGGTSERVQIARVTPSLFSVLSVAPHIGRLPTEADHGLDMAFGVLISHALWVRRYGSDPEIIGQTVEIDGNASVVVGVAQEGFHFPDPQTMMWLAWPQEGRPEAGMAGVRFLGMNGIGRLRPGVSLDEVNEDLARLVHLLPDAYSDITSDEIRERGLHARAEDYRHTVVGELSTTLLLVLGSSGFLMLIAWANVTTLMLLRIHRRRREIGIARALGASERRVTGSVLTESLLITVTGGLIGFALTYVVIDTRFGFSSGQLPRLEEVVVSGAVIGVVALLAVASGILMGAAALVEGRRPGVGPAPSDLSGRSTTGRDRLVGRRVLVATQMALAFALLVGSGLMARTYWQLNQFDLGFEPGEAIRFHLPVHPNIYGADYRSVARVQDLVLEALRAIPGVDAVESSTSSTFPLTVTPVPYVMPVTTMVQGFPGHEAEPHALVGFATPGYFEAMAIALVSGRPFRNEDSSRERPGVILSQALATDLFGARNPIGQQVRWVAMPRFPALTVIGVVGDVPAATIRDGGSRALYLPHLYPPLADAVTDGIHPFVPSDEVYVVRTTREASSLIPEIRGAVGEVDSRLVVTDISPLTGSLEESTARERLTMILLLISGGASMFLAVLGVYSVLAYSVRHRTAEFGIRLALGATPRQIIASVTLDGLMLTMSGIGAGLVASLFLTRFIGSLLYETSATDVVTLIGMTALLIGVAVGASYFPARRAGYIDPSRTLQAE